MSAETALGSVIAASANGAGARARMNPLPALEDPMGAIGSTPLSGRARVLNPPPGSDHASPLSSTSRTRRYPHRYPRDLRVPGAQPFNLGHHLPRSGRRREDIEAYGAQR